MLLMLLCCLIPITLIAGVSIFGFSLGALTPNLTFALVLLCPLMMFFMMRGMGHEHGTDDVQHTDTRHAAPTLRVKGLPPDAIKTNTAPPR